jgi:hypothetical protein
MSEYQYYEFQAIDKSLNRDQMLDLRGLSSRAEITPRRFKNVYNFGDFKGKPRALMEQYFDGFVYEANWGARQLMLKLPAASVNFVEASQFCSGEKVECWEKNGHVLFDFYVETEDSRYIDDEESEQWLDSLLDLRNEIGSGDMRALYLAWLSSVELNEKDLDQAGPKIPPNLEDLSDALETLTEFLRVDEDLIQAAIKLRAEGLIAPSGNSLSAVADVICEERKKAEAKEAALQKERHFAELEARAPYMWPTVESHLSTSRSSLHEKAIEIMKELAEMAKHRGCSNEFQKRIAQIYSANLKRPSIVRRIQEAKLV